jgi:hypothetical protein
MFIDGVDNQRLILGLKRLAFFRAENPGLGIQDWILKNRIFRAGYQCLIPKFIRAQLDI